MAARRREERRAQAEMAKDSYNQAIEEDSHALYIPETSQKTNLEEVGAGGGGGASQPMVTTKSTNNSMYVLPFSNLLFIDLIYCELE